MNRSLLRLPPYATESYFTRISAKNHKQNQEHSALSAYICASPADKRQSPAPVLACGKHTPSYLPCALHLPLTNQGSNRFPIAAAAACGRLELASAVHRHTCHAILPIMLVLPTKGCATGSKEHNLFGIGRREPALLARLNAAVLEGVP